MVYTVGIDYFLECAQDEATFTIFGGDILFLMRNLAACVTGPLQLKVQTAFQKVVLYI